jgi:hypothetical protein
MNKENTLIALKAAHILGIFLRIQYSSGKHEKRISYPIYKEHRKNTLQ